MAMTLDHLILGSDDLDRGMGWIEGATGIRPTLGGVHPGHGTRNALLSLGPAQYLEIMAPDPLQRTQDWYLELSTLRVPRLVGWAERTDDADALARRMINAGFPVEGPIDGSRGRPDGKTLHWKSVRLKDDRSGLLPFFIEWGGQVAHPAADAPRGCTLDCFAIRSPARHELARTLQDLGVDVSVDHGDKQQLMARIATPRGNLELTS